MKQLLSTVSPDSILADTPDGELRTLAKGKADWPRRTRELRTEDGWPVFTSLQGRPELPIGTYILDEDRQAPEHDRRIKDEVRIAM